MIERLYETDDYDANLWEFYLNDNPGIKYRVTDVSMPLPSLEAQTLNSGNKYYNDINHVEELSVTFRETIDGDISSMLWSWYNEIYDHKKKVFKSSISNPDFKGGKRNATLNMQKPSVKGQLIRLAQNKLSQFGLDVVPSEGVSAFNKASSAVRNIPGVSDEMSTIGDIVEDILFNNIIEFNLIGLRIKNPGDMEWSYANTDAKTITATFVLDDIDIANIEQLFSKYQLFQIGLAKKLSAGATSAGKAIGNIL